MRWAREKVDVVHQKMRGRTQIDNWGGGGGNYPYIRVLPDYFLLKSNVF